MLSPTVLLIAVAVVGAVLLLRLLVRAVGCNCGVCGRRMRRFEALPMQDRQAILAHYQRCEDRRPDTDAVFVCPACRLVYDDFSGERRSMEGDDRSICKVCGSPQVWHLGRLYTNGQIRGFVDANAQHVAEVECLRCQRQDRHCPLCDAETRVTGCRACHALYAWRTDADSGLSFLTVLGDRRVLREARDPTGGFV